MAYDNVIILGAGASYDAGIPLLNGFVDRMWRYAVRGKSADGVSDEDRKLFEQAEAVRGELERYSARASFNIRNVEDVLSLLSFEALAGGKDQERYETWTKAIARTIELSCLHRQVESPAPNNGRNSNYHEFWHCVLGGELHKSPPALITFNYDLVLERALWGYFHYLDNERIKPAVGSCKVKYFMDPYDFVVEAERHTYQLAPPGGGFGTLQRAGARASFKFNCEGQIDIPYLKLHGSLNWSSAVLADQRVRPVKGLQPATWPDHAVADPLILPPVFNKMNSGNVVSVWRTALEILREAKNIIIVGYSLPKTDIYMQYFMKSAVGPNSNLQWIWVFNPALFGDDGTAEEMKARYRDCFSP